MDSSHNAIQHILLDLHRSLERLSLSLTQSNVPYHPPPPSLPIPSVTFPQAAPAYSSSQSITPQPLPNSAPSHHPQRFSVPQARPSFTDVIRADILSQPAIRLPTTIINGKPTNLPRLSATKPRTLKNPVKTKLATLRSRSEKGLQACFKCGAIDHSTLACRNPLICFRCHKTGHRALHCSSSPNKNQPLNLSKPPITTSASQSQIPINPLPPPPFNLDKLPLITMFPRPIPTSDRLQEANILPPIRFYATPATSHFRNSLSQGVVLTDSRRLGAQYIQAHLTRLFPTPRWTWIARELPNHQFLIAPPDQQWRT